MRIPKQLKIGGVTYKVMWVDSGEGMPDVADINITTSVIRIVKGLDRPQAEAGLIHEIIHALNWEIGEQETEWVAQGIYQVFKDNKMFREGK